jgi:hypothetical protein
MPTATRRFPAPWTAERASQVWRIVDANGQPVAYTYGDDRSQGVAAEALMVEEARRIAIGIAKLPERWADRRVKAI